MGRVYDDLDMDQKKSKGSLVIQAGLDQQIPTRGLVFGRITGNLGMTDHVVLYFIQNYAKLMVFAVGCAMATFCLSHV